MSAVCRCWALLCGDLSYHSILIMVGEHCGSGSRGVVVWAVLMVMTDHDW